MNFLKLVNFEWNRLAKLLAIVLALVIGIQFAGTIYKSNSYMSRVNGEIQNGGMTEEQALDVFGPISFLDVSESAWFYGPIFIGVASVLFYIFFIWYRDWFGKNTFIYRLLMLPTERVNIYLSKLVTILMMTLSFIAVQLLALIGEIQVMKWIVPSHFLQELSVRGVLRSNIDTGLLFPGSFLEFVLYYGAGIILVAVVFTSILFERSFRLKGIVLGVIYAVVAVFLLLSPLLLNELVFNYYFFGVEIMMMTIGMALLLLAGSISMSWYLLRKKIRV